jgi:hypothetical protein
MEITKTKTIIRDSKSGKIITEMPFLYSMQETGIFIDDVSFELVATKIDRIEHGLMIREYVVEVSYLLDKLLKHL